MGASGSSSDRTIVLVGKTGGGKSSAGNTILGKKLFTSDASPNSTTHTSVKGERKVYGQTIRVIDTPGFFDTDRDERTYRSEIIRCIINCAAGVDAFLIVLKVERYTAQEMEIVDKIGQYFGENTFNHAMVLFTHGEQLRGQTIEEFVGRNHNLQALVHRCGGRCHVIDSKNWRKCLSSCVPLCPCSCGYRSNNFQVRNLLHTVNEIVESNGRYTNDVLQMVNETIIQRMMNEDTVPPNQQRERAERAVYESLLINLAGATVGALSGALLGTVGCVALFVSYLNDASTSEAARTGIRAADVGAGLVGGSGIGLAAGVTLSAVALGGFIAGGATGWQSAREADSVYDAIHRSVSATYERAQDAFGSTREFISFIYNPHTQQ